MAILAFLVPGVGEWQYNRLRKDPRAAYQSLAPYYTDLANLPAEQAQFLMQRVNERVWDDAQRRAFLATVRSLARWLPAQQKNLSERLARLNIPTLIVWGEKDKINSLENGRLLAELQPAARLTIIHGAGHNLQQEQPSALLEALERAASRRLTDLRLGWLQGDQGDFRAAVDAHAHDVRANPAVRVLHHIPHLVATEGIFPEPRTAQ